jgi:hypothetical protein
MNDGEEETEINMAKHDWGQLEEGVSHEEYVSCDTDIITCQVQTLEQIMDGKFTSDVFDDDDDGGGGGGGGGGGSSIVGTRGHQHCKEIAS